jgi:hypothetical protein
VLYGILCHCGNFPNDKFYEQDYKHCHGWLKFWMKSMPIVEIKFGVFCILW